ncbi:sulfide dehydrogenase (flavoprotein) subunit SudB [Longilinea arvoryzae]|uniref:Sulfide dehydrogenase (Flavoprotein) subunit SudB n=1 Tax=Longilinea arvoryzae TaxID=360412 RepID=A0A0K8MXK9_9CHLR|nr:sulfide/dihydroorotate dehydrogenase-like FAD/NAD-binding protein [Longilinea arvoryzae]GAP15940.1 sulfide dehydrogenase (flavoprotein) subunit SudB [Longilinea arvoryzae]
MFKIIEKQSLTPNTDLMIIDAPEIARKAAPGQFVILRKDETCERIPLTIADFDREQGTVTVIFQKVGKSTRELGELKSGDVIRNFVGPLGKPSTIKMYGGRVILVAGGVGIAPVYPIARALKDAGNYVYVIMGARSADLIFWEDKMNAVCDELILCTDDGSRGRKCVVTEPLTELLEAPWITGHVWAIGPAIMMKFCCKTVEPFDAPIDVSLDSIMVDGTGMCGACRVEVDGQMRFACVDGPEFDGSKVNWDVVLARKKVFSQEEQEAMQVWNREHQSEHICNLESAVRRQENRRVLPLAGD